MLVESLPHFKRILGKLDTFPPSLSAFLISSFSVPSCLVLYGQYRMLTDVAFEGACPTHAVSHKALQESDYLEPCKSVV